MKIGILTLPLHINYGGIMQVYALQTILERMGHDVIVFQKDVHPNYSLPFWKYPLAYGKRMLKKILVDKREPLNKEKINKREFPIIQQHLNTFINGHIHTVMYENVANINLSTIDCIVVGSDQIWRPIHVKNLLKTRIQDAYLSFTKDWDGLRVAYATSFGVENWEYTKKETEDCRKLVRLFNAVSVRELSAVGLCYKHLGINAVQVLDPTLLLKEDDYRYLIEKENDSSQKETLFSYILDDTPEKRLFVKQCAKKINKKIHNITINPIDKYASLDERIIPPLEQWLKAFRDADFVVTDSFHGCVFSILFNKKFIALGNAKRGNARFISLLSMFGMENRLITDFREENLNKIIEEKTIDVQDELCSLRDASMRFLKQSLDRAV